MECYPEGRIEQTQGRWIEGTGRMWEPNKTPE